MADMHTNGLGMYSSHMWTALRHRRRIPQPGSARLSVPSTDVRRCLISEREVAVSANSAIADLLRVNALRAKASDPTRSSARLVFRVKWMA